MLTPADPIAETPLRLLSGVAELLELSGHDAHLRAEADPARVESAWAHRDGSYGWVITSRRVDGRAHLSAYGPGPAAAALVVAVDKQTEGGLGSVTVPRDADRHLPTDYVLEPRNDWEWFATWSPPPVQPREDEVRWLDDVATDDLAAFLDRESPRHDARPGGPGVLRWCGISGPDGQLVAVAAHTERVPGVPHLASIAAAAHLRGRGLGAAVSAWITRAILDEGSTWVTLGMYSDNEVARRLYLRLGYRCDHRFTSGVLVRR